jgi:Leucine-rich repeat (LRR) protein
MYRVLASLCLLLFGWTAAHAETADEFARRLQKAGYYVTKKDNQYTEVREGSNYTFTAEDYRNLSLFPDLESLSLSATDEGLTEIARRTRLKTLGLRNATVTAAGLKKLATLDRLEVLDLWRVPVNDEALKALPAWKNLTHLELSDTDGVSISDAGLAELVKYPQLSWLKLDSVKINGTGFKALAGLNLNFLNVQFCHISDEGVKEIAGIRTLKVLSLNDTTITDAGVKHLAALSDLEYLDLGNNLFGITDACLPDLVSLKKLKDLSLLSARITDKGMKTLGKMTQLRALDLTNARLTDAGLKELQSLTNLTRLTLRFVNVSNAAKEAFKKAVPNCLID